MPDDVLIKGSFSQEDRTLSAQEGSDLIDGFLEWCEEMDINFDGSIFIPEGEYEVQSGARFAN